MGPIGWVVLAVIVVLLVGIGIWAWQYARRRRLQGQFGPEYNRAVEREGDQRSAEAQLEKIEQRRREITIEPLSEKSRARFDAEWRQLQSEFVDRPSATVAAADNLVERILREQGYPEGEHADLLAVDHPQVAESYRKAHESSERVGDGADTEELRVAMVHHRELLDELLRTPATNATSQQASTA